MILDLDIGNTRLKWRLDGHRSQSLLHKGEAAALAALPDMEPSLIRLSSVAGKTLTEALTAALVERWGIRPWQARVTASPFMALAYRDPCKLGVDRWLAMLAALEQGFDYAIVIDAGTAVTIDVLQNRRHLGGYIVPGLTLMENTLLGATQEISLQAGGFGGLEPGSSTGSCVKNGALLAAVGAVAHLRDSLEAQYRQAPQLLFTGGDGQQLQAHFHCGEYQQDMVLDGLAVAHKLHLNSQ